jgi:streptomycin 6-kinase
VRLERVLETPTSHIAYGWRDELAVVLKVVKQPGDEWDSGDVLKAFDGRGVARVVEHTGGAILLERLRPGDSLVDLALGGHDDEATGIIARVVRAMAPVRSPTVPTVEDWGLGFDRYLARDDRRINHAIVTDARRVYRALAESQTNTRLLHGDLQHSNVLFDANRGWAVIDPKGVLGEVEYELGAMLRNPSEAPTLFRARHTIERRVAILSNALGTSRERTFGWGFSQAVLSMIWDVEDGVTVDETHQLLPFIDAIAPLAAR